MKARVWVCAIAALSSSGTAVSAEPAGKAVYEKWCLPCHRSGQVGAVQLQLKYNGAVSAVLTERTDIQPALVRVVVRNGLAVMPSFRKTEISDAELDALATYLSSPAK